METKEQFIAILKRNGFAQTESGNFTKTSLHYPDTTTFYAMFTKDGGVYHKEVIYYDGRNYTVRNEFTANTPQELTRRLA